MEYTILRIITLIGSLTYIMQANTPSNLCSDIDRDKGIIAYKDSLTIFLKLNDIMGQPISDAHPELIFDGNTTNMKYSMHQDTQHTNLYIFTVAKGNSKTYISQDINITVKGNYKGDAYIFKRKTFNVYFK